MSLLISKNWPDNGPLSVCIAASLVTYLAIAQWPRDFGESDGDTQTGIAGNPTDGCYAHIAAVSGTALVSERHSCGPLFTAAYANALGLESPGAELHSSSVSNDQAVQAVSPNDANSALEDAAEAGRLVSGAQSSGGDLQASGTGQKLGPDRSCRSLFTSAYLLQKGEQVAEGSNEVSDVASDDSPKESVQVAESASISLTEPKVPSNTARAQSQPGASRTVQASAAPPQPATRSFKAAKRPSRPASLEAWWPALREGQLNILFVGGADFVTAIGLLSDGRFADAASANRLIRVKDASGKRVDALWSVSSNPALLLLRVEPGLYSVSIESGLTDSKGKALGETASGEVFVD